MLKIVQLVKTLYGVLHTASGNTPVIGDLQRLVVRHTVGTPQVIKTLSFVAILDSVLIFYVLHWLFKLILLGKLSVVAGSAIGGALTVLSTVLVVTIPALVNSLGVDMTMPESRVNDDGGAPSA